ncbi:MAG: aminotransferase class V-fold PLP-dependent enzyme, partial [Candidatus Paceibacterota bacterium]
MNKRIYLDNAATTPTDPRVVKAMLPYLGTVYGNAGALHEEGIRARRALSNAREKSARLLQVRREEIVFTSGGTEGDNIVVSGVMKKARKDGIKKPHIVTTAFEHSAIFEACKSLEESGDAEVTYVYPEKNGIVLAEKIKKAIKKNTILVSVMYVQNEIGTIQPIKEIARMVNGKKTKLKFPVFHTDACQAANYL